MGSSPIPSTPKLSLSSARLPEKENQPGSSPRTTCPAASAADPVPAERRVTISRTKGERLGMYVTRRDMATGAWSCMLTSVDAGGPADRAGMLIGDVITKVDGKPLKGPLKELLQRPRLKAATQIQLTVQRATLDESGGGSAKVRLGDYRVTALSADL